MFPRFKVHDSGTTKQTELRATLWLSSKMTYNSAMAEHGERGEKNEIQNGLLALKKDQPVSMAPLHSSGCLVM